MDTFFNLSFENDFGWDIVYFGNTHSHPDQLLHLYDVRYNMQATF